MSCVANKFGVVKNVRRLILLASLALLSQSPALAVQSIAISWNPGSGPGVAGYKIYSGGASRNYTNVMDAGNTTNLTLSGVADGSTNYYSATTYDAAGNESAYSTEVMFVAPASTPSAGNPPAALNAVTGLVATANPTNAESVILSWNTSADAGVAGYKIYYGTTSLTYTSVIDAGAATSLTIFGLADGTTNYFAATEYDASTNESAFSSEAAYATPAIITAPPATPPVLNAVTGLVAIANPTNAESSILSWNPSADAGVAGYKIYYGPASLAYTNVLDAGLATNLTVFGLADGTTNYFAVTEYDASTNESAYSSEAVYDVPAAAPPVILPPVLNVVSGLNVVTNPALANSVILSWTASTDVGVIGYQVYNGTVSGNYSMSRNLGLVNSLVITNLTPGTTNYFAVREYNAAWSESDVSSEVSLVLPRTVPVVFHAVGGLAVTAYPAITNSALLTWAAGTDAGVAGYQVFRGNLAGNYTQTQKVGLATSLVITGLVAGSTNYFAVREYDATTNKGPMSAAARWVAPLPPNTPPTLNTPANYTININTSVNVPLTGISSGSPAEKQKLTVITSCNNTGLIPTPKITYTSPNTTGTLNFKPANNQTGTAIITVTVNDGGANNNTVTRTFSVTVINQTLLNNLPKFSKQATNSLTLPGKPVTFGVAVTGQAPFKYQWKFNGTNLPGATAATLNIASAKMANAGAYYVQVSNSSGVTNSAVADLVIITNTAATLSGARVHTESNGRFTFLVTGVTGGQYVVEASTDLQKWTPVETNTSPFTHIELNPALYGQRYYRTHFFQQ